MRFVKPPTELRYQPPSEVVTFGSSMMISFVFFGLEPESIWNVSSVVLATSVPGEWSPVMYWAGVRLVPSLGLKQVTVKRENFQTAFVAGSAS